MRRALAVALALLGAGCTTPLAEGERLYRQGDRLGALETWRAIPETEDDHGSARARIAVVEEEFQQLVVRYKKRAQYYEEKERLAESILNYRLALKLQPDDAETLDHVQGLARQLGARKTTLQADYRGAFDRGDLPVARQNVEALRRLDPFDPALETEEARLREALRAEVTRRLAEGRAGFTAGNHAGARRAFRSVLDLDPDNESARGYLSYIATIRREQDATRDEPAAFEPPARFASDAQIRAEGFYQNGLAAERSGELYAAIRHDLRALSADSQHAGARRHLATLRRRLASEVDVLIQTGRRFFRDEDLQSALDQWQRALLIDPDNERAKAYIERAEGQIADLERLRAEPDVSAPGD